MDEESALESSDLQERRDLGSANDLKLSNFAVLTRRGLLSGAVAAAVVFPAGASSILPTVGWNELKGGIATISYLGLSRALQGSDFGPDATLFSESTDSPAQWLLTIANSRFPGTKVEANGQIRIFESDGIWQISFRFASIGLIETLLLADWLKDTAFPKGVPASGGGLSSAFPFAAIRLSKTTTLGLRKATASNGNLGSHFENVFQFEDEARRIEIGPEGVRPFAGSLIFYWTAGSTGGAQKNQPDELALSAVGAGAAAGPVTIVRPIGGADFDGVAAIGATAKATNLKIVEPTFQKGVFIYAGKSAADYKLAAAFVLDGGLAFSSKGGEGAAIWPDLPLNSASYRFAFERNRQVASLIGGVPEKATLIASGHVHLTVSYHGENEVARIEGGQVKAFCYLATLHHAYVPLHNADYSRFDFVGANVRFSLSELIGAEPPKAADFVYILGDLPVFGGVLDRGSTLRVHRASDLLDLKFGFRRLYLEARPGEAEIEDCAKKIGSVSVTSAEGPLLIVRFPPQAIAEKAFLRVDSGNSVPAKVEDRVPIGKHRAYQTSKSSDFVKAVENPASSLKDNQKQAREDRQNERDQKLQINEMNEIFDHLVEARASGETRIVFEFPPEENCTASCVRVGGEEPVLPLAFSLDALTRWDRLKTKVATRALAHNAPLEAQLQIVGIDPTTPLADKMAAIRSSLARNGEPTDEETSIEFPYRLQLSPSAGARWITPEAPDEEKIARGVSIFHARLNPDYGAHDVRAIWSPDFAANYKNFFHDDIYKRRHPAHSNLAPWLPNGQYTKQFQVGPLIKWKVFYDYPFRMSQDARDRYELVLLSSIYGLPALLPVPAVDLKNPQSPAKLNNDRKQGDSSVFPLPASYPTVSGPYGDEGVYSPRPLQRVDLALTSLGANIDLEGQWEPPSGFLSDAYSGVPLWPALTVERWKHKAFQGRDIQVEIVYKGFVLPFGHRCSVVKATERKFYADPAHPNGTSVAYLTQRFFVLVGRPTKAFPALGQPYGGRALPYSGVRIITTRSPDIADPFANDFKAMFPGALPRTESLGASAFVPVGGNKEPIQFEFVLQYPDGSESDRLSVPFVIADNTLVHDPVAVSELIGFYNREKPENNGSGIYFPANLRTATARGQRLRYAPSRDAGDTEFRTQSWIFGAHVRDLGMATTSTPYRPFIMDATMEGADQPPFYPAIAAASVEIQSLNAMNGKSSGFTSVSHDRHFLEHGFAPGRNDAEIYLAVLGDTHLSLQDRSNASGGIATPNNKIVSVSRIRGPVGGSAEKIATTLQTLIQTPLPSPAAMMAKPGKVVDLLTPANSSATVEYQLPASHQNKFDPLEFFGKALSQAKLFGIVPLKDIVRALSFVDGAPEMLERVTYTLFDFTEQAKGKAIGIISDLRDAMASGLSTGENQIKQYGESISSSLHLTGDDLYPGLFGALRQLISNLDALKNAISTFDASQPANQQNRDGIITATGDVAKASTQLLAEIKRVAEKPTPAIIDKMVGAIKAGIDALGAGLTVIVDEIKAAIDAEIDSLLTFEICIPPGLKPVEIADNLAEQFSLLSPVFGFFWENFAPPAAGTGPSCVTVRLLEPDSRRRAQDALFYETVGKPIIDGSLALESLKAKLLSGAMDVDTAVKELPRQLLSAAESWLDGILSLHRLLALADQFKATGMEVLWDKVVVPTFQSGLLPFVQPILKNSADIATRAETINKKLLTLIEEASRLLRGNSLPAAYLTKVQQVSTTLAKAQKGLAGAIAEHDAISALVRENFFDTSKSYQSDINGYLLPLKIRFDQNAQIALIRVQELIARLLTQKDHVFRAARDALEAGLESISVVKAIEDATQASLLRTGSGLANPALLPGSGAGADITTLRRLGVEILTNLGELTKLLLAFDLSDCVGKPENEKTACLKPFKDLFQKADALYRGASAKAEAIAGTNKRLVDNISAAVADLAAAGTTASIVDKTKVLAGRTDEAVAYVFGEERYLTGLLAQGFAFYYKVGDPHSVLDVVQGKVYGALKPVLLRALRVIVGLHDSAKSLYDQLKNLFLTIPDQEKALLRLFLSHEFFELIDGTDAAIQATFDTEKQALKDIETQLNLANGAAGAEAFRKFVEAWINGAQRPAALAALDPIVNALDIVLTGKVSDLIDLSGLRRAVQDALLAFVPNEIAFDYGWSTTLEPFPSESTKMFWIEEELFRPPPVPESLVAGYIDKKNKAPENGEKSKHDLVIVSKAGIRIKSLEEPPEPYFQVESEIFSPSINLFGASFDIVTIRLEHIRFKGDEHGTDLDVKVRSSTAKGSAGVEFGQVVEYISDLASIFPSFVPPWLDILFDPPGVIAKFGFPAFSVSIGNMSILNLAIGVQVEVPFDNRAITGRFMVSERDRPFLISFAPYGGGGYFALKTQATSIVGFEMQLEFGAVVGVNFGPLHGFGLVAAGIYIEKEQGKDIIIAGFVRAIGEATLGCFAIGLHIEVRVTQEGSNVTGSATFSYSFKVAFAKFRFSFTANYAFAGGSKGNTSSISASSSSLLSAPASGSATAGSCSNRPTKITVDIPDRYIQWRRYRANFAP